MGGSRTLLTLPIIACIWLPMKDPISYSRFLDFPLISVISLIYKSRNRLISGGGSNPAKIYNSLQNHTS